MALSMTVDLRSQMVFVLAPFKAEHCLGRKESLIDSVYDINCMVESNGNADQETINRHIDPWHLCKCVRHAGSIKVV